MSTSLTIDTLIDGCRVEGGSSFLVKDRFDGSPVARVAETSAEQIDHAVAVARAAVALSPAPYDRCDILLRAVDIVAASAERFVEAMTAEAGFVVADARSEVSRGLDTLRLSAEEAKRLVGQTVPLDGNRGQEGRIGFTVRMPVGVVCAITPFNSPFNAVLHKVGPALAGGNAVILKPSDYTPVTASLICDALLEAELPAGLIALVNGKAEVGQRLVEHEGIDFYSFTGSTAVGRLVHAGAGLRRTQLELGSIACTIVCEDADLRKAAAKIVRASFRKAGQVCTSVQRLYVHSSRFEDMVQALVELASALRVGDPRDPATDVGPMINEAHARRAERSIAQAQEGGAAIRCGGTRTGSVLDPTIVTGTQPGMSVVDEEIFAPVLSVIPFDELAQAIEDVNGTPFGLAAGIFTADIGSALAAARRLRTGAVHINETSSSRVDSMPYGGVKDSGFGREGPAYAIREMTDEKVVTLGV